MSERRWSVAAPARLAAEVKTQLELSHRKAQGLIDRGAVRVDGAVVTDHGARLEAGAEIVVRTDAPRRRVDGAPPLASILHEDTHIVVVAKPPGLLTVPRDAHRELPVSRREPNLEDWLRERDVKRGERPQIHVVQRLDRGTSGVLLFARTKLAAETLKPAFARHEIDRRYQAIVLGAPPLDEGTLAHKLVEKPGDGRSRVIAAHPTEPGAKDAVTHYTVLERFTSPDRSTRATRLELRLETGRRNQIRVSCAIAGFPLLGDATYGEASELIARPALHAAFLGFRHPRSKERMEFSMETPADLAEAWSAVIAGRAGSDETSD